MKSVPLNRALDAVSNILGGWFIGIFIFICAFTVFMSVTNCIAYGNIASNGGNGDISKKDFDLLEDITNSLPIICNGEVGERPDLLLREYYANILNLVTDNATGFDDSDNFKYGTITLTEKAWKPFKTHQLPLYIGLPGYVDVIRSLGFDVFDDFINHSYDKEQNHIERIKIVVEELNRLTQLDMLEFYNQNRKRFVKNCANIYKLKAEAYLELNDFIIQNDLI